MHIEKVTGSSIFAKLLIAPRDEQKKHGLILGGKTNYFVHKIYIFLS